MVTNSMDGDNDGLGDYEETMGILPGNPGLGDSDGDGVSDKVEHQLGMDPMVNPVAAWTPVYSPSPAKSTRIPLGTLQAMPLPLLK